MASDLNAPPLARRMACWLYEGMLLFGVVFAAGLIFSIVGQMRSGIDPRQGLFKVFLFVVCGIYFTWFWARGQTLAMRTWHIRIVDRHGRPLTQLRALLRYLYCWVWFIPPLAALESRRFGLIDAFVLWLGWVAFWALASRLHPLRQFWHDALAGTRLVTAEPPR